MRTIFRKKLLLVIGVAVFIISLLSLDVVERNCRLHAAKLFYEASKDTARALATSDKRAYDARADMMHKVLISMETIAEVVNTFPHILETHNDSLTGLRDGMGITRIDIIRMADEVILASSDRSVVGKKASASDLPAPVEDNNPDFNSFVASVGSYHTVDYVTDRSGRELLLFYSGLKDKKLMLRLGFLAKNFKTTYNVAENELVTGSLPRGENGGVDVVGQNGVILNSVKKECIGRNISEVYAVSSLKDAEAGTFVRGRRSGVQSFFSWYPTQYGYTLISFMPVNEVYATRRTVLAVMLFGYAILFIALFFSTSHIVKIVMIDGLERINDSLAQIEAGDLDTKVEEDSSPEFSALSQGINSTVDALKLLMESQSAHDAEQMALARTIQLSCLPKFFPTYPEMEELDLCARTTPAQEVGGDFYDYFRIKDGLYCVMIADVSEHGIPAALLMMTAKTAIHDAVLSGDTLEHCMESVNFSLCENNSTCMFVTAFVATIDISTGEFCFVNAGHCRPLLRRSSGIWEEAKIKSGMVLGGIDNLSYSSEKIMLNPGDRVFLYTDGVTESRGTDDSIFGTGGLEILLNRPVCDDYDPASLVNLVNDELIKFRGDADPEDDVTMAAFEYYGSRPSARFLKINAEEAEMDNVLEFVENLLEDEELAADKEVSIRSAVDTAVDDIFKNIVSYAGRGRTEPVKVTIRAEVQSYPHQLIMHFIDNGHPYDPTAAAEPNTECDLKDRPCGGLGIFIVRKLMDQMSYRYKEGRNILRLVKNLD